MSYTYRYNTQSDCLEICEHDGSIDRVLVSVARESIVNLFREEDPFIFKPKRKSKLYDIVCQYDPFKSRERPSRSSIYCGVKSQIRVMCG